MTTRRQFLLAGALSALVTRNAAAQTRQVRIGILSGASLDKSAAAPALLNALAKLGYRDKAGMLLEYRYSGDPAGFPALAEELIAARCDLAFALVSEPAARAFRDARSSVPVVFLAFDYDPVAKGIVQSLRRPGGNMTGVYTPNDALIAKRLEIAQEMLPGASHFLVLTDSHTKDQLAALRGAAAARRVQLTVFEYAQPPYDLAAGLEAGRRNKVHGLILFFSPEFTARRADLSALVTTRYKMPVIGSAGTATQPGTLVSYYANVGRLFRRAAEMGAQILKGAKAGDIPVDQPLEFDLVINQRTAKALGVKVPSSLLGRATRVIE